MAHSVIILSFEDLTNYDLYAVLKLRSEVFVVEQNCVYSDLDDKDQRSLHLLMKEKGKLIGYARILPPGLSYDYPSIGRVVIHPEQRGRKLAHGLMTSCINFIYQEYDSKKIIISAQSYLKKFYTGLGFVQSGEEYLEDGIPHVKMIYTHGN